MWLMGKGWLHVLLYSGEKRLLGHQNRMDEPRKKRGRRKEWHWDFKTSTWGKHLAATIQLTGRKWQIWLLTWRTVWSYLWSHLDKDFIFNPVPSNCIVPAKSGDVPLRKTQKQPKFSHPQHLSFRISKWLLKSAPATPTKEILVFPPHSCRPYLRWERINMYSSLKRHWILLTMNRFHYRSWVFATLQIRLYLLWC